MSKHTFESAVDNIVAKHSAYKRDAYFFLRDCLDHTLKNLRGDELIEHRHISGPEFLEGMRAYALKEFGSMSLPILESWGVKTSADIGEMVYHLIEEKQFGRSEDDHPKDFEKWSDFESAFQGPYRPNRAVLAEFDLSEKEF